MGDRARRPGSVRVGDGSRVPRARGPEPPPAEAGEGGSPPRINLTRRAAVLASALCAVVLLLAYPLRQYAAQRGEINSLRRQNEATSQRVAALTEQQRRWQDPAYVRQQARERLHYVMPGETAYLLFHGSPSPSPSPSGSDSASPQR